MPLPPVVAPIPGLSQSALDIIKSALRLVNVLGSGANPTASEAEDALAILNQMIDAWQIDRLMIYTVNRLALDINGNAFTLQSGKQSYSVGVGGLFNTPRPARIDAISLIYLSNAAQPLELPLEPQTDEMWAAIPVKNVTGTIPTKFWNDLNFPAMNLNFWPVPTQANQIVLYAWQLLAFFPNLASKLQFPPGYLECLRYNLAVRLAAEFGVQQIPSTIPALANEAMAKVKSFNIPLIDLGMDSALTGNGYYNWLSDTFVKH